MGEKICAVTGFEFKVNAIIGMNGKSKRDAEENLKKALHDKFPCRNFKIYPIHDECPEERDAFVGKCDMCEQEKEIAFTWRFVEDGKRWDFCKKCRDIIKTGKEQPTQLNPSWVVDSIIELREDVEKLKKK